jgi:hypothetical protein
MWSFIRDLTTCLCADLLRLVGREEGVSLDGMDTRARHRITVFVVRWAYGPGDSQAPREEPEHDQGPPQAFGPSAPSHRGAFGEGEGGFPPGYHVPYAGEGPEDGADDPGEDSDVGGEGPERTLTIALAVYEDSSRLPDGILVAVSPDQEIAIYRLDEPPPTMTDGTIIYANQFTAEQYAAWSRRMYGDLSNH